MPKQNTRVTGAESGAVAGKETAVTENGAAVAENGAAVAENGAAVAGKRTVRKTGADAGRAISKSSITDTPPTRKTGVDTGRTAQLVDPFPDLLRKRGVNCKGYGILFKFPMLDTALTIEAKGIYCYICSYAGSDSTAFPSRDRIMADLKMCKDAYYRHYQLLLDNDYLRVEQKNMGGNSHGFLKNVYEIVECPRKFAGQPDKSHLEEAYARIRSGGLHDGGFGYIPRAVMVDGRLSVKAKALYGYYRSFSGAGAAACPEKKDLLYHLGISDKLYLRLMGELTGLGYITVTQRHIGGRLSVNDVYINTEPVVTPVREKNLQVIRREADGSFVSQKQDTQIKDVQKQGGQKQDVQKQDAIKNNPNKNKKEQEQFSHQQSIRGASADGAMGEMREKAMGEGKDEVKGETRGEVRGEVRGEARGKARDGARGERRDEARSETREGTRGEARNETSEEEIAAVLQREEGFPRQWLGDRRRVGLCLQVLTDYEGRREVDSEDLEPGSTYLLFLEALTDMLCARRPMELTGDRVSADEVAQHLERYLHHSFARNTLALYDLEELVRESYEEGCRSRLVRNPLGYCKACVWTALKTGDAALRARIVHDLGY